MIEGVSEGALQNLVAAAETLKAPRGENLRTALYLFGRDEAVRFLRAG